jgi:hypothetical protein
VSAAELPIPAELAMDAPPLTDDDLDAYFGYLAEHEDSDAELDHVAEQPEAYRADIVEALPAHRFRIVDDGQAEWAMRKLAAAEAELEELRLRAEDWKERIQAWFDQAARRPQRSAAFFTGHLESYAVARREATGAATVTLPSGVVRTSGRKPAAEVADAREVASLLDRAAVGAESVAWKKALDAVESENLWRWEPKVSIGELRRLVHVEERKVGTTMSLDFACGHERIYDFSGEPEDVPDPGETMTCVECGGEQRIIAVGTGNRMALVVVGPDGQPVPGMTVKPAAVNVSVSVAR